MHEPPSDELVRQLTELQLCQPHDLRRARGKVRKLAFDLPTFDSVWIDSLVQLRLLTPYQAKQFELGQAGKLRIGSFIAIDELARSVRGTTLLARRLNRRDRCVVKRRIVESARLANSRRQMVAVLEQSNHFVHPQLVVPNEILPSDENEIVLVSRYVPGLPLNELLVRRGRFPAAIAFEIGRQMLEGLAALHTKSLVHGDIRLSNVRLTESGLAVLVDGGIRQVVHPRFTIHDTLAPDAYDGIAPELIGTGVAASASSELYAVGCLLWQLLAGRPPFVTADPLAKLASHQTKTIDDVRQWAPDTPALLAETIKRMTSPNPHERPRSFDEVLQHWGSPGASSRSRLRQFRRLFDGTTPHLAGSAPGENIRGWLWTTAAMIAVTGGLTVLYDNGLRNELLSVARTVRTAIRNPRGGESGRSDAGANQMRPAAPTNSVSGALTLPKPDSDGVILLEASGPYVADRQTFEGHLIIRGAPGVTPEILVENASLSLMALEVTLERVSVRRSSSGNLAASLIVRSQSLRLLNCDFPVTDPESSVDSTDQATAAIAWTPLNPREAGSGHIVIENSFFHGNGDAFRLAQTPQSIRVVNSLKTGTAPFFAFGQDCATIDWTLELDGVTLRDSGPLVWVSEDSTDKPTRSMTSIRASNCIFKLAGNKSSAGSKSSTGRKSEAENKSGLIVYDTDRMPGSISESIEFSAEDSVVEPDTVLLGKFSRSRGDVEKMDDDTFSGLIASDIRFSGPSEHRVGDSKALPMQIPRVENGPLPGIDPRRIGPAVSDRPRSDQKNGSDR